MEGKPQVVTIPNGTQFRVEIIGTVRLKNGVILKNVLYVPKFCFNLISVSKLIRDLNCNVIFNANECLIQESLMKKHLLLGKAEYGLYFLQEGLSRSFKEFNKEWCTSATAAHNHDVTCNDAKLWLLRLGHLPFKQLDFLFLDLKVKNIDKEIFCTICPLAKKAREPFFYK